MHAKLVGNGCYADWYPATAGQPQQAKPAIIGTPPQGLQFDDPNAFHIAGLPSGDYQLFVEFRWYSANNAAANTAVAPNEKVKPQMTFTVKDGEVLDLKEIKVNVPAPDKKLLEASEVDETDDDMPLPPDFRP